MESQKLAEKCFIQGVETKLDLEYYYFFALLWNETWKIMVFDAIKLFSLISCIHAMAAVPSPNHFTQGN